MAGKRVFLEHVIERCVQPLERRLPRHKRALGEVRGQQRLPHAADGARAQHRLNSFDDGWQVHTGLPGDFPKRIALKPLNAVFRHREDARIERITRFDG